MRFWKVLPAALVLATAGVTPDVSLAADTADTVFYGGSILTMVGDAPAYVEALAVKDGKIAFTGTKVEALAMTGELDQGRGPRG